MTIVRSAWVTTGACVLLCSAAIPARADEGVSLRARLAGFQEVIPAGGAVFSTGSGRFRGRIAPAAQSLEYELSYDFPDATPPVGAQFVNQAHLHFGQRHTTGNIIACLCASADNPSPTAGTPTCPSPGGTVSGMLTGASVLGPSDQGISSGDVSALIKARRAGAVYANVHTDPFPAGEIRGQVTARDRD